MKELELARIKSSSVHKYNEKNENDENNMNDKNDNHVEIHYMNNHNGDVPDSPVVETLFVGNKMNQQDATDGKGETNVE